MRRGARQTGKPGEFRRKNSGGANPPGFSQRNKLRPFPVSVRSCGNAAVPCPYAGARSAGRQNPKNRAPPAKGMHGGAVCAPARRIGRSPGQEGGRIRDAGNRFYRFSFFSASIGLSVLIFRMAYIMVENTTRNTLSAAMPIAVHGSRKSVW